MQTHPQIHMETGQSAVLTRLQYPARNARTGAGGGPSRLTRSGMGPLNCINTLEQWNTFLISENIAGTCGPIAEHVLWIWPRHG